MIDKINESELKEKLESLHKEIDRYKNRKEILLKETKELEEKIMEVENEINRIIVGCVDNLKEGTICTFETKNEYRYKCKVIIVENYDRYTFLPINDYYGYDFEQYKLLNYNCIYTDTLIEQFEKDYNCKIVKVKEPRNNDRLIK